MGLVGRMVAVLSERRALTESDWLKKALGVTDTYTGRSVGVSDALTYSAVYACVRRISENVGSLPLITYRRLAGGGKDRAEAHALYDLLKNQPNPEMTAQSFWECLSGHIETRGNAYAEIEVDNGGRIVGLWPLRPDRMQVWRDDTIDHAPLRYLYRVGNHEVRLDPDSVLHIPGFGYDGLIGYSPVSLFREVIALGLAIEEFGARFFGNDSRPGGILTTKGRLKDPERLKKAWEQAHQGLSNRHRVAVLEEDVSWQQIGIAPEDAQFLETRKFQRSEIASIWGVPPHLIGDLERATFSNVEMQSLEFVTYTLRPRLRRFEQAILTRLFRNSEGKRSHFAEFLVDGLLRGDIKSRYDAYATARQNGWLSADDVREFENMNPLPGDVGKIYWQPVNVLPAGTPAPNPDASMGGVDAP